MRRQILWLAIAIITPMRLGGFAMAEDANAWLGREVLPKTAAVALHVGKRALPWPGGKPRLKVERVEGEWLWLGEGWAQAKDVVSLADAEAFYTAEIERRPTAFAYAHRAYSRGCNRRPGELEDAEQALRLDPRNALAYYCRGMAQIVEGRIAEGIRDLDKTIGFEPQFGAAYRNRGSARAKLHERDSTLADLDDALADLNEAVRLDPKDSSALVNRGAILCDQGNYEKAHVDLDAAIRINPNQSGAYNNRSGVWFGQGKYERAIDDADIAIRLDPANAEAFANRGRYQSALGEYEQAEQDFSKAIELAPRVARLFRLRGNSRFFLEKYADSFDDFNRAIELEPKSARAFYGRAAALDAQGDLQGAIANLDSAIALDPKDADYFAARGLLRLGLKQVDRAFRDLDHAIRLDPKSASVRAARRCAFHVRQVP